MEPPTIADSKWERFGGSVGQVRKDILNGWKEIGGYVCRDIRTVERWEKQRGLPVRRVPGAGRSTVYALIPEVDEWLARTKTTLQGAEDDLASPPADPLPRLYAESAAPAVEQASPEHVAQPPASTLADPTPPVPQLVPPPSAAPSRSWRWIAVAALGGALLLDAVWPSLHHRANPQAAEIAHFSFEADRAAPGIPYRSRVRGVDDLYLRGIYFYEQRTPDSLQRSLGNFQDAIARDPGYAPAYAGLANTYNLMREYSTMPDAEAYPKAKAAAEHAIALDPKLPQAHASLGFVLFFWMHNATQAEAEFRNAIALDPSSIVARHWYGSMLVHEGRFQEAMEQLDLAQRLQPTSAAILSTRALALGLNGHRDEAAGMLQDLLTEVPIATSPHAILATLSLIQPRDPPRFLDEARRVAELRHNKELLQVMNAAEPAYHAGGENAMWLAILDQEQKLHPRPEDRTYQMMQADAALGRTDAAFADLDQLTRKDDPLVIGIVVEPTLIPLHHDPRFAAALKTIGLPPLPAQ